MIPGKGDHGAEAIVNFERSEHRPPTKAPADQADARRVDLRRNVGIGRPKE
jgi:hypothetical protein